MRNLRPLLRSFTIGLSSAVLLVACAQPDARPAPDANANAKPGATDRGAAAAAPRGGDALHADACGSEPAGSACGDAACGDAASACGQSAASCEGAPAVADDAAPALRRVAADQVCMRTNRFLGRQQLTAEVEGHAYFGCCAGCAKQLRENPAVRTAKDPVTGHAVDKSAAVIGARPDGTVVYFESDETFARAGGA